MKFCECGKPLLPMSVDGKEFACFFCGKSYEAYPQCYVSRIATEEQLKEYKRLEKIKSNFLNSYGSILNLTEAEFKAHLQKEKVAPKKENYLNNEFVKGAIEIMQEKCHAITKNGVQCKNAQKHGHFCGMHFKEFHNEFVKNCISKIEKERNECYASTEGQEWCDTFIKILDGNQ